MSRLACLREAGHEVIGLFMRHGQTEEAACAAETPAATDPLPIVSRLAHKQGCCTASDAQDARRVADRLDIPFYAVNFEAEFGQIIDYFVDEYSSGRTPNPCVMCNNWLKFGKLFDYADSVGAEFVATGHYARLLPAAAGQSPALCRGRRSQARTSPTCCLASGGTTCRGFMFPVGDFEKSDAFARSPRGLGLRVAEKKDSQEICFVTRGDYADFVRRRRGEEDLSGEIVTTDGARRRPSCRHRELHHWAAEGAGRGLRRAAVRRPLGARDAPRGHRASGRACLHADHGYATPIGSSMSRLSRSAAR